MSYLKYVYKGCYIHGPFESGRDKYLCVRTLMYVSNVKLIIIASCTLLEAHLLILTYHTYEISTLSHLYELDHFKFP